MDYTNVVVSFYFFFGGGGGGLCIVGTLPLIITFPPGVLVGDPLGLSGFELLPRLFFLVIDVIFI